MKLHTQRERGNNLNAHICVQGKRGRDVKRWVIKCIHVINRRALTVLLKEIPGSSILKLFNVVAIYASKIFPVNIEQ